MNQNQLAVEALKSALSRIDNASAIDSTHLSPTSIQVAGATVGLGSSEAPRRELTEADINQILLEEIRELQSAIEIVKDDTCNEYYASLEAKLSILQPYIGI